MSSIYKSRSLDNVDKELLFKAVRAGLLNQDGRARGSYSSLYKLLSFDQLKPLLPSIHAAIAKPSPSGIMFGDQIRTAGLELFANNKIDEGIELLADYARNMKQHGSEHRVIKVLNMLKKYGAHAQRVIPHLEETARYFDKEPNFPQRLRVVKAKAVRDTINELKAMKERPALRKMAD